MNEPTHKCPECGAYTYAHQSQEQHSYVCSKSGTTHAGLEKQIEFLNKRLIEDREYYRAYAKKFRVQSDQWKGKWHAVCQENNRLRRKLDWRIYRRPKGDFCPMFELWLKSTP